MTTVGVILSTTAVRSSGARRTLESLLAQRVDAVHVVRVGRSEEPLPVDSRVTYEWAPEGQGPAFRARSMPMTDVVLSVDDDILYPPDYVARTLEVLERDGNAVAVSYHCSYWPKHRTGYGGHERSGFPHRHCVEYQHGERELYSYPHGGAGVMSFWRPSMQPSEEEMRAFEFENDILFSALLRQNGVHILRPPTAPMWLAPNPLPGGSLWESAIRDRYRAKNAAIVEAARRFGFTMTDRARY